MPIQEPEQYREKRTEEFGGLLGGLASRSSSRRQLPKSRKNALSDFCQSAIKVGFRRRNIFISNRPKRNLKSLPAVTAFGLALVLALISPSLANIKDLSGWAVQLGNAVLINNPLNSDSPLGTNLTAIADWSTEMPFLNAFKSSRKWITQCASGEPGCSGAWDTNEYDKLDLDEGGWVKSLPAPEEPPEYTGVRTILLDNDRYPGGQYVVLYDGEGTIEYRFDAQKNLAASTPGRDVIDVTPSGSGIHLIITSTDPKKTGNYIRNIRVVPAAHEKNYQSEIFTPDFQEKIKKFRALRFMDWMGTNNSEQTEWAKRPKVEKASYAYGGGVPVEIMVELANRMEADPWFNMPHMATDEYMTEFAQMVKNTLKSNLNVYVEFSNEVWNWRFKQAHYALEQGKARWGQDKGDAFIQWYGMRTAQMCDIWKSAFGNQKNRVVCVMGTQTAWKGLENYPLECSYWVAEGNKPCYQHGIDAYAVAGYFGGGLGAPEHSSTVESWLNDPDGGFGKAFQQLKEGGMLPGSKDSLPDLYEAFTYHLKAAEEKGLKLVAYEGGQHITGALGGENNERLTKFFIELNRRPEMYGLYIQLLKDWKTAGGTLFMHFSNIGRPDKWGSWGALEHLQQNGSPKYNALLEFIDSTPCWWDGCARAELIPYHKIARNFSLGK